jgi:hypothetical protein
MTKNGDLNGKIPHRYGRHQAENETKRIEGTHATQKFKLHYDSVSTNRRNQRAIFIQH